MGCIPSKSVGGGLDSTERVMKGRRGIDKTERIHSAPERARPSLERAKVAADASPPKLDADGRLVAEEVVRRISGSVEAEEAVLGDVRSSGDDGDGDGVVHVRYAALTQRGYYPDDPHKENQDAYRVVPAGFASGGGDAFFAVFDGHGDHGGDCARFAGRTLHERLAKNVKRRRAAENAARLKAMDAEGRPRPRNAFHPSGWPYLDAGQYEACCRAAHLQCNEAMHKDNKVKDTVSGTTSISVGFHGGRMTVSNCGDSRAVLGCRVAPDRGSAEEEKEEEKEEIGDEDDPGAPPRRGAGRVVAVPLSEDQTPYRRDERDRLKRAGARVCSIDQMEGLAPMHEDWGEVDLGVDIDVRGDPPRVWRQDHDYPGTAFSRSLGDSVGEDIGIDAEPEMITKEITGGDEFLVVASDGVFEFLTNQRVIDICAGCDDPLQACTRLLDESYKQWLHYERRTDDITCIVLFLKNGRPDDGEVVRSLIDKRHRTKKMATQVDARKNNR